MAYYWPYNKVPNPSQVPQGLTSFLWLSLYHLPACYVCLKPDPSLFPEDSHSLLLQEVFSSLALSLTLLILISVLCWKTTSSRKLSKTSCLSHVLSHTSWPHSIYLDLTWNMCLPRQPSQPCEQYGVGGLIGPLLCAVAGTASDT